MKTCDEQPIFEIEIQIYFYIKAIFGVSLLSWRMQLIEKKISQKTCRDVIKLHMFVQL